MRMPLSTRTVAVIAFTLVLFSAGPGHVAMLGQTPAPRAFHLLEASIADVHSAIQQGQVTCRALVQAYVNRARAYNGTCNQLVTEANVNQYLPDYAEYKAAVNATAALPPESNLRPYASSPRRMRSRR